MRTTFTFEPQLHAYAGRFLQLKASLWFIMHYHALSADLTSQCQIAFSDHVCLKHHNEKAHEAITVLRISSEKLHNCLTILRKDAKATDFQVRET